jgi:DNA polymerase-3 subunit epsilon/CBS domain-containing protein
VNPGVPLPEVARNITGITEADLAGAPAFPAAMAEFAKWADTPVVVGYSVGFDIAILANEHSRHDLEWVPPCSLDILHLVEVLKPRLPDTSLETVAAWLGVETQGRHRALADARIAAEILAAIIPRLRDCGITTLAQAERIAAMHSGLDPVEARAGWASPRMPGSGIGDYARVDSFPYRHRVGDLMSAPPLGIAPTATLTMALAQMVQTATSSAVVQADGAYGILTERDILRAIDIDGAEVLGRKVSDYASFPLVTIDTDEFAYRALALLRRHGFRHLGVTGLDQALVGVLTSRDLLAQRADEAVSLGDRIQGAETAAALGRIWTDLVTVTRALLGEGVEVPVIASIISAELRRLHNIGLGNRLPGQNR